jgi:DnaK suppressor protein
VAKKPASAKAAKSAAKKPAAKPVVAHKAAKPAPKPVAKKVAKPVAKPPVAKPAAKPVAKPATKPAAVARPAKGKPVASQPAAAPAKAAPVEKKYSPPAASPFKGKVASATAMVLPRNANATAHASHKPSKNTSSSMNKQAAKILDNGVTREDGRYALPATTQIALPKGYRPSNKEEYMNPMHLAYFRNKLRDWRDQLVEESRQTMDNLRDEVRDVGDEAERATRETENSLELRTRDRYRKLISKIDKALRRIEEGSYGYCEETDEEIGVDRLDARPIATLSLDAQERREHLQKQMGD